MILEINFTSGDNTINLKPRGEENSIVFKHTVILNLKVLNPELARTDSPYRVQNKDFLHCRLKLRARGSCRV